MTPPKDLPSVLVALGKSFALQAGIPLDDLWDYLYKRKAPPKGIRDALVAAFFPIVSPDDFLPPGLTSPNTHNTIDTVEATPNSLRSRARLSDESRRHPFIKAVTKANVTLADVATILEKRLGRKVPRSSVQAWPKKHTDRYYRPIPQDAAEALEALYKVPMTAWHRVVKKP